MLTVTRRELSGRAHRDRRTALPDRIGELVSAPSPPDHHASSMEPLPGWHGHGHGHSVTRDLGPDSGLTGSPGSPSRVRVQAPRAGAGVRRRSRRGGSFDAVQVHRHPRRPADRVAAPQAAAIPRGPSRACVCVPVLRVTDRAVPVTVLGSRGRVTGSLGGVGAVPKTKLPAADFKSTKQPNFDGFFLAPTFLI
jgi:hypothetical protein